MNSSDRLRGGLRKITEILMGIPTRNFFDLKCFLFIYRRFYEQQEVLYRPCVVCQSCIVLIAGFSPRRSGLRSLWSK
jgi:hypothetical protein